MKDKVVAIILVSLIFIIVILCMIFKDTTTKTNNIPISAKVVEIEKFKKGGHEYIIYVHEDGNNIIIHSPECWCLSNNL